jgi:uncharacterized HAD superfamily protein
MMKNKLAINFEAFTERYLSLPTTVGRITSGTFDHIGEVSRSKMQGWSEKNLAWVAREVLLKSVIQSYSVNPDIQYVCFLANKEFC